MPELNKHRRKHPQAVSLTIYLPPKVNDLLLDLRARSRASKGDIIAGAILHFAPLSAEDRESFMLTVNALQQPEAPEPVPQ